MSLISTKTALNEFREKINFARAHHQKINIQGGQSKSWYGDRPVGNILSTLNYQGIIEYQPEELVITVRAGTPLSEVLGTLDEKNQMFAFEPPHFGSHTTIGGMVAAGLAGPGRAQAGNLRDFVLGADMMDGTGQVLSFGGKVMKNVAGYDVSRLIPGSMGTLALLLDVSIKVLPKPVASQTLMFELSQTSAITQMNTWASQPLPISASAWIGEVGNGQMFIRLSGAQAAVDAAVIKMNHEISAHRLSDEDAQIFWQGLREQTHNFFHLKEQESLWRFCVNPVSGPINLPGQTCLEWLGGQRWYKGNISKDEAKSIAMKHQGHATLFKGEKVPGQSVFTSLEDNPLTAPLAIVQQRLRHAFDPDGVFQTSRMP